MKFLSACILTLLLVTPPAHGDILKEVTTASTYDGNVFGTSAASSDYITNVSAYVANRFTSTGTATRVFYSGSGYLFARSSDRLFSVHGLGISHARRLGDHRNMLYAGASLNLRVNRSVYEIYDYNGFNAYVRSKWYSGKDLMFVAGYALTTRTYWNLGDEGYREHNASLQATKFLPSGTTLRGDVGYGYKSHFGSEGQLLLGAQVAQSLHPGLGLSIRYQRRLNTQTPSYASEDLAYLDEDLLVDRYDYGGHEFTAKLTWMTPVEAKVLLEGGRETQRYDGQAALDIDEMPLATLEDRFDQITFGSVTLEIPISRRLNLGLDYQIESGNSNDAYYDYDGRKRLGVTLDVGL